MATKKERLTRSPQARVKGMAVSQLSMLLVQFLAGIAVSLIGLPSQTSGAGRVVTSVVLALHILVAIGLLAGAIMAVGPSASLGVPATTLAWVGFGVIVVTFAAGVLTMITSSNWWSYLMAVGATALLVIYGLLYLRAGSASEAAAG